MLEACGLCIGKWIADANAEKVNNSKITYFNECFLRREECCTFKTYAGRLDRNLRHLA